MRTFLELGETYVEVNLRTPSWAFSEAETRRRQLWSFAARLCAWLGLTVVLVAILVALFFSSVADARRFEVCVSSQMVEVGREPVVNPMSCE